MKNELVDKIKKLFEESNTEVNDYDKLVEVEWSISNALGYFDPYHMMCDALEVEPKVSVEQISEINDLEEEIFGFSFRNRTLSTPKNI